MEIHKDKEQAAYIACNIPHILIIDGQELYFKAPPLKNDIYKYRCRKSQCNYFIKINRDNIKKFINKEKDINYTECNQHSNHIDKIIKEKSSNNIHTPEEEYKIALSLIKFNINQGLSFHLTNFKTNNINWRKGKIRALLYKLREEFFPKEEEFLRDIGNIKIKLSDSNEIGEEPFCLAKGEFINYNKKNIVEKYIIFGSLFQLNLFKEIDELFIDGTFKVAPKNWYQLLNIFAYIKNKNFYLPISYIFLSSKNIELYMEVFRILKKNIELINKDINF